jgi:apolipoprotein N-acyltransferase
LHDHIKKNDYYLLSGTLDFKDNLAKRFKYNSAYFFGPVNKVPDVYRKIQLVPVEEAFPYTRYLPEWILPVGSEDLTAGTEYKLFSLRTKLYDLSYRDEDWTVLRQTSSDTVIRFSVVICYESIFPDFVQRFIDKGTQLLIIITNDGWFGYTSQPFQHFQTAVYRALEQRISVLRCANNGISAFIDPYGRRFLESGLFQQTMAQKVIPLRAERTFYSKYGDLTGIFCGILVFSFLTLIILGRSKKDAKFSGLSTNE